MAQDKLASRYAKAMLGFLKDPDRVRLVIRELSVFAETAESHSELKYVLTTELFSEKERLDVLEAVVRRLNVSEQTLRMLRLLSNSRRLKETDAIARKLNLLLLEAADVVPLAVCSSAELESIEKKKVE